MKEVIENKTGYELITTEAGVRLLRFIIAASFHIWTFFHYKKKKIEHENLGAGFPGFHTSSWGSFLGDISLYALNWAWKLLQSPWNRDHVRLDGLMTRGMKNQPTGGKTEKGQEDEAGIPKMVLVLAVAMPS